jgi:hypothetical protein
MKPRRRRKPADETLDEFRSSIRELDDLIYGVALLYEGLSLLYSEQPAMLETHRKHLRNAIQKGNAVSRRASGLLRAAEDDPRRIDSLRSFKFSAFEDHPDADRLKASARAFADAYERLFPGRPRDREFTADEALRLVDKAAGAFRAV